MNVQALGFTLLHFLWQGAAVAALLASLDVLLRRAAPQVRYALASVALLVMAALPAVTFLLVDARSGAALGEPAVEATAAATDEARAHGAAPLIATIAPSPARLRSWMEPALPALVVGWGMGVLLLSLRALGGWGLAQRLRRAGLAAAPAEAQAALARLAGRLRVMAPVRLFESALVEVPTVVGWLRPVLLLPASALTGLSPQQLELILAHELAHIRRHDYLVNLLQTAVETVLFYHPAVWWVSHRMRVEREHCCDDRAVAACGNAVVYARALADLEERRAGRPTLALAATGGSLLDRVRRLAGPPPHLSRSTRGLAAILAVAVLSVAGGAGSLLVAQEPPHAAPRPMPVDDLPSADVPLPLVPEDGDVEEAEAPEALDGEELEIDVEPSEDEDALFEIDVAELEIPEPPELPEAPEAFELPDEDLDADAPEVPEPPDAPCPPEGQPVPPVPPAPRLPMTAPVPPLAPGAPLMPLAPGAPLAPLAPGAPLVPVVAPGAPPAPVPPPPPPPERRSDLRRHGVTREWIAAMAAAGYPSLSAQELLALRAQGVGPAYVRGLADEGYERLSTERLLALRAQGVTPAYLRALKREGLTEVLPKDAVRLRAFGVTPSFVRELKQAGLTDLTHARLVALRSAGVDGRYVARLEALGYADLSSTRLMALRAQGVTPEYVRGLAALGYRDLGTGLLIALRAQGVTPDYVRELKAAGVTGLSSGALIALRAHGVDGAFAREVKAEGQEPLTADRLIALRAEGRRMGWMGTWWKRLRSGRL